MDEFFRRLMGPAFGRGVSIGRFATDILTIHHEAWDPPIRPSSRARLCPPGRWQRAPLPTNPEVFVPLIAQVLAGDAARRRTLIRNLLAARTPPR